MPTIRIRPRAKSDLADIWDDIADDSEERADSFLGTIDEKITVLAENPLIGRSGNELAGDSRSWPINRYIVFYFPLTDRVEIVRVLHGSRDIEHLLHEDDF